ncbi:MAG TPA: MauE/DoxX family redox-associated membrane protein [Acidimicrobiales bacterium]|nr:MauE/DoxX family redox-associated membrane protein [Acidimicrobiales bacterium]
MELIGPYLVACALLLIAGVMKVIRPDGTARAVALVVPDRLRRPLQFRVLRVLIRMGALAEVVLGTVAIFLPRPLPAALVATSYAAFGGVVLYVRSRGGSLASCGCFGPLDTPATRLHAVINFGLVIPAVAVAVGAPPGASTVGILAAQPLYGLPFLAAGALCIWLTYLALSSLAQLQAARQLVGSAAGKWS